LKIKELFKKERHINRVKVALRKLVNREETIVTERNYGIRQRKKALKFIYLLHYIGILSKEEMEKLTGSSLKSVD
jgi:hypothetical protein